MARPVERITESAFGQWIFKGIPGQRNAIVAAKAHPFFQLLAAAALPMGSELPTIAKAEADIAKYEAFIAECESSEEAAIQMGQIGLASFYELTMAAVRGQIQNLRDWIAFLSQ